MQIEPVDPRDDATFAQWVDVVNAAIHADRPEDNGYPVEVLRANALDGQVRADGSLPADELRDQLAARVDGRLVAAVRIEQPLTDNTNTLFFLLQVLPEYRRRGIGSALLDEVLRRAKDAGRALLMTEVDEPPPLEGRSPGRAFALRHGFGEALPEVRRDLPLPVPEERLANIEETARPHAVGYRLVSWRDRCPEELVNERADLARQMSLDVPLGDLAWDEEAWDAERVRHREALLARQGRSVVGAGAVHEESGRLVAFTELALDRAQPQDVYQWETFVLDAHRGHRLGMLIKLAVLRRLQAEVPEARRVLTTNATTNAPMIAVNEAMGFRPNGRLSTWQRAL